MGQQNYFAPLTRCRENRRGCPALKIMRRRYVHKRTIFCELFPSKTVSTSQAKYVYDEGSKIYFSRLFIGL